LRRWRRGTGTLSPTQTTGGVVIGPGGQSFNGSDGDGDNDNDGDREEMPFVTTTKKRRKSDTPGILRGLRADKNSSYWES